MLQVIEEILRNPDDKTEISFMFANKSVQDIILKKHIDELAAKHSNFKVYYVVDKAPMGGITWRGGTGHITENMAKKHLPAPSDDSLILVCIVVGLPIAWT